MKNKIYIHATDGERDAIVRYAQENRLTWGYSTMADGAHLFVVHDVGIHAEGYLVANFKTYPDMLDPAARLAAAHVALLPQGCGVTTEDSTYSAMRKVATHTGILAIHPLFSPTRAR